MKKWLAENKIRLLLGVMAAAVLTAAFFAGENPQPQTKDTSIHLPEESSVVVSEPVSVLPESSAVPESREEKEPESVLPESSAEEAVSETVPESSEENIEAAESSVILPESSEISETAVSEASTETESSTEESMMTESSVPESVVSQNHCIISINCAAALGNEKLRQNIRKILPPDGNILIGTEVAFDDGASAFDVLQKICREKGIHLEYSAVPLTGGAYIEGIANLYEFDCGSLSGWMFSVNGTFPNVGCSDIRLSDGDSIDFLYTCDMGNDIGNPYRGN